MSFNLKHPTGSYQFTSALHSLYFNFVLSLNNTLCHDPDLVGFHFEMQSTFELNLMCKSQIKIDFVLSFYLLQLCHFGRYFGFHFIFFISESDVIFIADNRMATKIITCNIDYAEKPNQYCNIEIHLGAVIINRSCMSLIF